MSSFPGTVLKQQLSAEDYEILRNISTETFAKNSNFIDLSEMHSIMIAQLGNASLREIYANETENSSHYVVFLDDGRGRSGERPRQTGTRKVHRKRSDAGGADGRYRHRPQRKFHRAGWNRQRMKPEMSTWIQSRSIMDL